MTFWNIALALGDIVIIESLTLSRLFIEEASAPIDVDSRNQEIDCCASYLRIAH